MKLCIHYGFGDYLICYGMIKELAKTNDEIVLFAIPHRSSLHFENIRRLYSTIPSVTISTDVPADHEGVTYIGWGAFREAVAKGYNEPFAKFFYAQAGVPLSKLWDNFEFSRDIEKEKEVFYERFKLSDGEVFDFIHDDPHRNYRIRPQYFDKVRTVQLMDLPDVSLLDMLYTIERSRRFHTFTTGLASFVDQMNITHNDLNFHRYIRPTLYDQPILRLNWNIID